MWVGRDKAGGKDTGDVVVAPAGTVCGVGRWGMWPRLVDELSIAQD